ncbi:hypothetical protein BJY04DRAFT_222996 [Aspergillus karnatakaensis]|uniref:GNAT family N-acetyltransferase n=1 Tax=Aspergillus karnatakaensis TaxID=1810916 RepID=UPI003CCE30F6
MALNAICRQTPIFRTPPINPHPQPHPSTRLLEAAEATFFTTQITSARTLHPNTGFTTAKFNSGIAGISKRQFDWKLNRVAGLGMDGPVLETDIDRIEAMFAKVGMAPYIDLAPCAHPSALQILRRRGYNVCGEVNVHTLLLRDYHAESEGREHVGIEVKRVKGEEDEKHFVDSSIAGFESNGRGVELLRTLAHSAILYPNAETYVARIDGRVAGGAGLVFIDTPLGRVAEVYISSTVPEYRGRGVQTALLRRRLLDAKRSGVEIVVVNTRPGTPSARNVGRLGFRMDYTRETLSRRR